MTNMFMHSLFYLCNKMEEKHIVCTLKQNLSTHKGFIAVLLFSLKNAGLENLIGNNLVAFKSCKVV